MSDPIIKEFRAVQLAEARNLAEESDILTIQAEPVPDPQRFIATFAVEGLVKDENDEVCRFDRFDIGIWLPDDYLRHAEVARVLTYLGPHPRPWHPNIRPPFVCVDVTPGLGLCDIILACHELLGWQLYGVGDEGLNHAAAQWARQQPADRFPIDPRPLKRRTMQLHVEMQPARKESQS